MDGFQGIAVSVSQAEQQKALYDSMHECNKRTILKVYLSSEIDFCHRKRAGSFVELMSRYTL